MKATLRIPTKETFAFVEVELTDPEELLAENIKSTYDSLTALFRDSSSVEAELDAVVELCDTGSLADGADRYANMSEKGKAALQAVKRLIKRNK